MDCTVLIVSDNALQSHELVSLITKQLDYKCEQLPRLQQLLAQAQHGPLPKYNVILFAGEKPDAELLSYLPELQLRLPHTSFVLMVDYAMQDHPRLDAPQLFDILVRPVSLPALRRCLARAAQVHRMRQYIRWLEQKMAGHISLRDVVGEHLAICAVREEGPRYAASSAPLLIAGEEGSGKEWLARAIHGSGPRATKPFVAFHCESWMQPYGEKFITQQDEAFSPEERLQSAIHDAEGGTLFIQQPDMLTAPLREIMFSALANAQSAGRVRLIFSQYHRQLGHLQGLSQGRAFEVLCLPPLRERKDDIMLLSRHFLALYSASERKYIREISENACHWLMHQPWPGNIAQLAYTIRRAVIVCDGLSIGLDDVRRASSSESLIRASRPEIIDERGRIKPLRSIEEDAIRYALEHSGGSMTGAARSLGIGRSTLYRKVHEMDIDARAYISRANQTTRPTTITSSNPRS